MGLGTKIYQSITLAASDTDVHRRSIIFEDIAISAYRFLAMGAYSVAAGAAVAAEHYLLAAERNLIVLVRDGGAGIGKVKNKTEPQGPPRTVDRTRVMTAGTLGLIQHVFAYFDRNPHPRIILVTAADQADHAIAALHVDVLRVLPPAVPQQDEAPAVAPTESESHPAMLNSVTEVEIDAMIQSIMVQYAQSLEEQDVALELVALADAVVEVVTTSRDGDMAILHPADASVARTLRTSQSGVQLDAKYAVRDALSNMAAVWTSPVDQFKNMWLVAALCGDNRASHAGDGFSWESTAKTLGGLDDLGLPGVASAIAQAWKASAERKNGPSQDVSLALLERAVWRALWCSFAPFGVVDEPLRHLADADKQKLMAFSEHVVTAQPIADFPNGRFTHLYADLVHPQLASFRTDFLERFCPGSGALGPAQANEITVALDLLPPAGLDADSFGTFLAGSPVQLNCSYSAWPIQFKPYSASILTEMRVVVSEGTGVRSAQKYDSDDEDDASTLGTFSTATGLTWNAGEGSEAYVARAAAKKELRRLRFKADLAVLSATPKLQPFAAAVFAVEDALLDANDDSTWRENHQDYYLTLRAFRALARDGLDVFDDPAPRMDCWSLYRLRQTCRDGKDERIYTVRNTDAVETNMHVSANSERRSVNFVSTLVVQMLPEPPLWVFSKTSLWFKFDEAMRRAHRLIDLGLLVTPWLARRPTLVRALLYCDEEGSKTRRRYYEHLYTVVHLLGLYNSEESKIHLPTRGHIDSKELKAYLLGKEPLPASPPASILPFKYFYLKNLLGVLGAEDLDFSKAETHYFTQRFDVMISQKVRADYDEASGRPVRSGTKRSRATSSASSSSSSSAMLAMPIGSGSAGPSTSASSTFFDGGLSGSGPRKEYQRHEISLEGALLLPFKKKSKLAASMLPEQRRSARLFPESFLASLEDRDSFVKLFDLIKNEMATMPEVKQRANGYFERLRSVFEMLQPFHNIVDPTSPEADKGLFKAWREDKADGAPVLVLASCLTVMHQRLAKAGKLPKQPKKKGKGKAR